MSPPEAMQQAAAAYNNGDLARAEQLCRSVLEAQADCFEALNLLGVIAVRTRRSEEAADLLRRAVAARPGDATAHNNYGNVLRELNRFAEALESYQRALAIKPDFAGAHYNHGDALQELGRFEAALESYERALAIRPDFAEAHINRGNALQELRRFEAALECFRRALAIRPDYPEAHFNRGNALRELERLGEALDSYQRALTIRPDYAEAWNNRGNTLQQLRRLDEALECYQRALTIRPDYAEACNNQGLALHELKRFPEALDSYQRALRINPDYAEAHNNRGNTLLALDRVVEALQSFGRALTIRPDYDWLYGAWLHTRMRLCDWNDLASQTETLAVRIHQANKATPPFAVLALSDSPSLQRRAAEIWVDEKYPATPSAPPIAKRPRRERIRLGYYSADFHNHATAYLMAELFERHDRKRFELVAFSYGPDQHDDMRKRLTATFDRFIDVRASSDGEVARMSRELQIDIAVDLKGFTQDARTGIFSRRAAPVQVSYLGYPGTMGAPYIDYLVADHTLVPPESRQHYAERIVYLPHSYQVNDRQRPIADRQFTRAELGLPPAGFVFCCFNNSYKITPDTFAGWMRILKAVAGSVLWLSENNAGTAGNLRREAQARGVNAARLAFAPRMSSPEHLARHRAADLFIDTLPCNAHTTASDALWAGLPVLTRIGESFAGRVAASLLHAVGLPELIAATPEDYEAMAIGLADNPTRLAGIRERLASNRSTMPLFDCELFARHLEDAYRQMYERYQADLPPEHIDVRRLNLPPGFAG
jgi:protein O-GlcNAc transferase